MKYRSDEAYVVYCSSDLFSEVCAVAMTSLFENNKHFKSISVFVIDDAISEKNKKRINSIAKKYSRNVVFIPLPVASEFYGDERFNLKSLGHTYARMILGDIIPTEVERIISLDSDTMVLGKIDELWNTEMGDHPIAGVDDCMGKVALVKTQHLPANCAHCNAGMFLIDLSIWRKENWTNKFFLYMKGLFDKGIALGGYEEEVMNKLLHKRMLVLPPKFNLMTLEQVLSYKEIWKFRQPVHYYTEKEIQEAKNHPVITHTTNFFYIRKRIFEEGSDHPQRKNYVKYRKLTPWATEPAMSMNSTFKQRIQKNIWHWMPRFMAIKVANFVRNEVRPRLEKKRDDE